MSEAFAKAGPPLNHVGVVEIGIKSAIAALGEPTEAQIENMERNKYNSKVSSALINDDSNSRPLSQNPARILFNLIFKIINKGRVICFTSYKAESDLQDYFRNTLNQHNKTDTLVEG